MRIDHLGIVVENLDEALHFFTVTLKATVLSCERNAGGRPLDIAFVETGGTMYELMHPNGPGTKFFTYLQEHGPGMHHIAFVVDELDQTTKQLTEVGVRLDGEAQGNDHRVLQWLDPKTTLGVGMQLIHRRD